MSSITGASGASAGGIGREHYLAMGLSSCALILYEIAITRLASAILFYHFAFLALSLGMLGIAAPGVWFALRRPGSKALPLALSIAGVSMPASVAVLFGVGRVLSLGAEDVAVGSLTSLALLALGVSLVPLLALGSAICVLLIRAKGNRVGSMYGADLAGSTVAAALIIPLMGLIDTPKMVALAGILPFVALLLVHRTWRPVAAVGVVLIAGAVAWGTPFDLRFNRAYVEESEPLFESWTPTGRITVDESGMEGAFGWGWGYRYEGTFQNQLMVYQEGGAGTPIMELPEWPVDMGFLLYDVTTVGLQLAQPERACVIGAGGGRDVLSALQAGATDVDAVELNPTTMRAVSETFGEYSGNPYGLPGVSGYASEGRSFLTRSRGGYDTIVISLVDSWAATAAGAYALSENYLYTTEALQLYWSRLSDRGVASITRWFDPDRASEAARIAATARLALAEEGVAEPLRHIALVQAGQVMTVMMSKTPFTDDFLGRLDAINAERGFLRHWPPASDSPPSLIQTVLLAEPMIAFFGGHELAPTRDDRPFFFQTISPFQDLSEIDDETIDFNSQSTLTLRYLMAAIALLTLVLVLVPMLRRGSGRLGRGMRGTSYFAAIGLAFMFVELALIQKFILYLGHPSYATTCVIASLLLGAGTGSTLAGRFPLRRVLKARLVLPLVVLVASQLTIVFEPTLGLPTAARVAISVALLLPAGFVMGFAFPVGMMAFPEERRAWHWAVNGAASVLGSVLSLAFAMEVGFSAVILLGVALYLVAAVLLPRELSAQKSV